MNRVEKFKECFWEEKGYLKYSTQNWAIIDDALEYGYNKGRNKIIRRIAYIANGHGLKKIKRR